MAVISPRASRVRAPWGWLIALVLACVVLWAVLRAFPENPWKAWVNSLPPTALLGALVVLPVFGFPISVLHIATGARLGLGYGMLAVAISTLVHLLLAYFLAHHVSQPVRRILAAFGWKIPNVPTGAAWPFTIWITLLPGVSYALKNVIPPLTGVGLRVYLGAELPLHVAKSLVGLTLGQATIDFSWGLALFVVLYTCVLLTLTRHLARRFRASTARHAGPGAVTLTASDESAEPASQPSGT